MDLASVFSEAVGGSSGLRRPSLGGEGVLSVNFLSNLHLVALGVGDQRNLLVLEVQGRVDPKFLLGSPGEEVDHLLPAG